MPLRARRGPALLAFIAALLLSWARPALAWVDVTLEGDDVRVAVQSNGSARVEHRITLKIAGGPLRSFDVRGVDRDAVPELDGYIVPAREAASNSLASAVAITPELMPPGNKPEPDGSPALSTLRIRFQNEKGIGRGVYVILVRYTTNLASHITPDGSMAKLAWTGPAWDEGLASVRVTFELPAAPNEPRGEDATARAADPDALRAQATGDHPLILTTLRHGLKTDALELLRPYVPKGEAARWVVLADLRAFTVTSPELRRPAAPSHDSGTFLTAPAARTLWIVGALGLFGLYAVLCALKSAEVSRDAAAAGVTARPLVPLPAPLRAVLAGAALASGLWIELLARKATLGALLVLAASLLAAHLPPPWKRGSRLRGPGRWLPVAEAEAFRDAPRGTGGYFDASTRAGKVALVLVLAALGAGVVLLHDISPYQAELVAFDVTALLAVFGTGLRSGLPPEPGRAPGRFLRDVARRIRKTLPAADLRIVGKIRIPEGAAEPDELRLSIAPRNATPGFVGIEIGVVYVPGMGGPIGLPEVLLRVSEGSVCETSLADIARLARAARGRKAKERVLTFAPRLPTVRMTAGLAARLITAVTAQGSATIATPPARRDRVRRAA